MKAPGGRVEEAGAGAGARVKSSPETPGDEDDD